MTALEIICKYYPDDNDLRRLLIHHGRQVADRALRVADLHPELYLDREFLVHASLLHDIGIYQTDAPGIFCYGQYPYLMHGCIGATIMRREGDKRTARVCERHTGTGISAATVSVQCLPLPPGDYVPETLEEQVICYADKFFSKSHPEHERTIEEVVRSLSKYGVGSIVRFREWVERFE